MTKHRGRIQDFKRLQRLCPTPQHHVYGTVGAENGGASSVYTVSIVTVDERPLGEYDFSRQAEYMPQNIKLNMRRQGDNGWAEYLFGADFMCLDGKDSGTVRLWSLREYALAYAGVKEEQASA